MHYDPIMHELGSFEAPMTTRTYVPSPALSPYIKNYSALKKEWACDADSHWYILPDNSAHLIFYLFLKNGRMKPSLRLIGPRSRHLVINRHHRYFTFIMSFRPGGLAPFCPFPLADLCDKAIDADELFSWCNDTLLEQLAVTSQRDDLRDFIAQLETALISGIIPGQQVNAIVKEFTVLNLIPQIRVADISNRLGITERYLRDLCHKHIGHSPKSALQIERFTQSLVMSNSFREWTAIAHDAGYYDQSHMIAEYQRMTGKSPEQLFA
jgi:AraC-like DNA-binding protein